MFRATVATIALSLTVTSASSAQRAEVERYEAMVTELERPRYYHFYEKKGRHEWTDEMTRFRIDGNRITNEGVIRLRDNPRPE